MLEQAGALFDDMAGMLSRIKKKIYSERMAYFRQKNEPILAEMVRFVEQAGIKKKQKFRKKRRRRLRKPLRTQWRRALPNGEK